MAPALKVGILISGSGRSLQNFIDLIGRGELPIQIAVVVSSREDAYGIERARRHALPVEIVPRKKYKDVEMFSNDISGVLDRHAVDLVLLAGFLSLYRIPDRYLGRVINIHPALLPKFGGRGMYGHHVHEEVIAAGEKETGCTVHFADNQYDHGGVILQRKIPVLPKDTPETLADRVFAEECIAYPEAVRRLVEGKTTWASSKAT